MATTDSGTETLFSDDSPCDLNTVRSPSVGSGDETEVQTEDPVRQSTTTRLTQPPNIQPYSGVLEKGKVLIRPIAFKPSPNGTNDRGRTRCGIMTPSTAPSRFGLTGNERYGSTPILTRPGSRLTLYGSTNDLHQVRRDTANYSLDRKLRSLCPSTSSSPPLAMSSLTSLPHKLMNYDSLESVRKSPMSMHDGSLIDKNSYRLSGVGGTGSLLDLTPSPSDSGVSELEAALRDRDSELAYLRQTMEHNEQVIFRVYQEKEKVWERELRRMKSVHEGRLRASAQKVLKLEQTLMMQTYQLQQDKKRLSDEAQRANLQCERLRQELNALRSRLEETEWSLCQKTGEISLLKTQLKESQIEQTTKCQEVLQLRNENRETRELVETRNIEITDLKQRSEEKDQEIILLKEEVDRLQSEQKFEIEKNYEDISENERLRAEVRELREELSDMSLNEYGNIEPGRRTQASCQDSIEDMEIQRLNGTTSENSCCSEVEKLKEEMEIKKKFFEKERLVWAQEKEKVLRYQRQLQMNYVQMYRRTRALEKEIENFTIELDLDKNGVGKQISSLDLTQTIEL